MKTRHKWSEPDAHGDQTCGACGLQSTKVSNSRRQIGHSLGTHREYWVVREWGNGSLEKQLVGWAPDCKPGTDYYAAWRAYRAEKAKADRKHMLSAPPADPGDL